MQAFVSVLLLLFLALSPVESDLRVFSLRATNLPSNLFGVTDGFVKVFFNDFLLGQTSVVPNKRHPTWDEEFEIMFASETDLLRLEVYDEDVFNDELVGVCPGPLQIGVHQAECALKKGGRLFYTYELKV